MFSKLTPSCAQLVLKGAPLGWEELAYPTLTLSFLQWLLQLRAQSQGADHLGTPYWTPTSSAAANICQVDFQSLLTCADSQQQGDNENIGVNFQPLKLLTPINMAVAQSDLNAAVRN